MAFRYKVVKKTVGTSPYTTRPDLGTPLTEEEFMLRIQESSSMGFGDIKSIFAQARSILIDTARNGRPSETILDLFRLGLTSGGSIDDPQQHLSADDLDPHMRLYPAGSVQREFRANLTLERTGIDGDRVPKIEAVRNTRTNNLDSYTPGNVLRVSGEDLKVVVEDTDTGVFFRPEAGGSEVRVAQYIDNTEGTLTVLLPAELTGPQRLIVRAKFGNHLRETVYTEVLVQE
ncbi:MAG: DUF4469 domain-containing protein [Hormoscilla sp.]